MNEQAWFSRSRIIYVSDEFALDSTLLLPVGRWMLAKVQWGRCEKLIRQREISLGETALNRNSNEFTIGRCSVYGNWKLIWSRVNLNKLIKFWRQGNTRTGSERLQTTISISESTLMFLNTKKIKLPWNNGHSLVFWWLQSDLKIFHLNHV